MPAPAGVLTEAPVVLLTLEHAGRVWRVASRPCDILDGATWRHYRGGLAQLDVFEDAPLFGMAETQSQSVEMIVDTDLAELAAQRHGLSEIRAELALWRDGDPLDRRMPMLCGRADVESGGFLGQPLRLSIVGDDPVGSPGVYPSANQQINQDTWSDLTGNFTYDEVNDGSGYPQVIGQAGTIVSGGSWASVPATPVYSVGFTIGVTTLIRNSPWGYVPSWATLPFGAPPYYLGLLSYGWVYPGEGAKKGRVRAFLDSGTTPPDEMECSMYYLRDALGQVVTALWNNAGAGEVFPSSGSGFDPGGTYYAAISPPCSGIARPDYLGGLEGAGTVIRWALSQSRVTVDWRRTSAALPALDRYRVAGFWDQSCSPWAWVVDNLLPLLPCTWVPGPQGLYPVVWRLDATADQADITLIDGLNCCIEGDPQEEGADDVRSRLVLDYANGLLGGNWRRRATWHGQPTTTTTRESASLHLRRAQQRYGSQRGGTLLALEDTQSSDLIYADRMADRTLGWRSRFSSVPRITLKAVSDGIRHRSKHGQARVGMVAAVTSSRHSLSSRVAHVTRPGWLGGLCYTNLVILESP